MEIYTNFTLKAEVNPRDVIKKLIEKSIGSNGWVFEEDGKFYRGSNQSSGTHSYSDKEEITEEQYSYVKALQTILDGLHRRYIK